MKRNLYKTRRLTIRPYTAKDYQAWLFAYSESLPKQYKYDTEPYAKSEFPPKMFKEIRQRHAKLAKNDKTYIWGVFENKSGLLVGALDIHILCRGDIQKANLGYQVFNLYWRRGLAKESVLKLSKGALIDLKLNRLEAIIDLDNIPSKKLVTSLGFRREGVRENYYYQNDDWADQVVYVIDRKTLKLPKLKLN